MLGNLRNSVFPPMTEHSLDSCFVLPPLVDLRGLILAIPVATLVIWVVSQSAQRHQKNIQVPRTLPYILPLLRSTIPFVFDGLNFCSHASYSNRDQSTIRVALLEEDVYMVHGAKNVAELLRTSSLTVTRAYGIALEYCFGMARKAVRTYVTDTSGSQHKPIVGSNVHPQNRVSYPTHENLLKGLLGPGLAPTSDRFESALTESLSSSTVSKEWVKFPDLPEFFENHVGSAVVQAIFGSTLLGQNPKFVRDLWAYDRDVMSLAKRLPAFWIPDAYEIRNKLLLSIKRWHAFARARSDKAQKPQIEDSDQFWGCEMIRSRHKMLLGVKDQDFDSLASTDLGLIWATVTNVVPSSMTLVLHVLRDISLLVGVRKCITETVGQGATAKFDLRKLEKQPLLLSLYAETLRFGVQIHIPRCSPHRELKIGNMLIPKNKLVLVNTWLAHTDDALWNTKNGAFPLDDFWARRFLVDPKDPSSGPTKKSCASEKTEKKIENDEGLHFSTEGLEGAWIPYGGGHHACPGRVLAKRIMLLSCAMIISMFDIEILADEKALEYGSPRFGFGVRKPVGKVPFRIRRRNIALIPNSDRAVVGQGLTS